MGKLEINVPLVIVRDTQFYCYRSANEEVMATQLVKPETLHLATGEESFEIGDYELIHSDATVTFMHQVDFEEEFELVEDPQNVTVTPLGEDVTDALQAAVDNEKEGGD